MESYHTCQHTFAGVIICHILCIYAGKSNIFKFETDYVKERCQLLMQNYVGLSFMWRTEYNGSSQCSGMQSLQHCFVQTHICKKDFLEWVNFTYNHSWLWFKWFWNLYCTRKGSHIPYFEETSDPIHKLDFEAKEKVHPSWNRLLHDEIKLLWDSALDMIITICTPQRFAEHFIVWRRKKFSYLKNARQE